MGERRLKAVVVRGRMIGEPPLKEGNVKGVTVDLKNLNKEYLTKLGWDVHTSVPTEAKLRELGLDSLLADRAKWNVPAVD